MTHAKEQDIHKSSEKKQRGNTQSCNEKRVQRKGRRIGGTEKSARGNKASQFGYFFFREGFSLDAWASFSLVPTLSFVFEQSLSCEGDGDDDEIACASVLVPRSGDSRSISS